MDEDQAVRGYCEVLDAVSETGTALLALGEDGLISALSRRAEELFGYRAAEVVGRPPQILVEAPWPAWARLISEAREKGSMSIEGAGVRKDGGRFPLKAVIMPRRDGERRWMAAVVRDLSESPSATRLAGRLAAITRLSFDALVETTPDGTITDWNLGAEQLYGYRAEEVVGRSVRTLSPQHNWPAEQELLQQVALGNTEQYESERQHKDGSRFMVTEVAAPLPGDAGEIAGAAFMARRLDPPHRFQLEVLEALPDAVLAVDATGRITMVNSETERMFGYSRRQLLGRTVEVLVPESTRRPHVKARMDDPGGTHERSFGTGLDLRGRRSDGTVFPVDIALKRVPLRDGMVTLAVVRDQTDHRKAEDERVRLLAQAERARMSAVAAQADRLGSLGELAGGIAHQFNNLLGVMAASTEFLAELLEAHHASEQAAADLDRLRTAGQRAARLTRQLLIFGRRDIAAPQPVDLNALVDGAVTLLRSTLGEHIDIKVRLGDGLPPAMADANQLEQVLVDLALNARDAMPGGGTLTIATDLAEPAEPAGFAAAAAAGPEAPEAPAGAADTDHPVKGARQYLRLVVTDTGTGMPPEVADRAFEPFFTTKPVGQGTGLGLGLGLSAVHGIITQAGGSVTIDTRPGAGATVSIVLPATDSPLPAAPAVHDRPAEPTPPAADRREAATILVVEDEPDLLAVTQRTLARHGFTVLTAPDGEHALRVAQEHHGPIHLLLTDVVMPGLPGPEVAARIRAERPGTPVLLMSGYARPDALPGALGPDTPLLKKPFAPAVLLNTVQEIIAAHAPTHGSPSREPGR